MKNWSTDYYGHNVVNRTAQEAALEDMNDNGENTTVFEGIDFSF